MLSLTLDTNCIVHLETGWEPAASSLREVIEFQRAGEIRLRVIAIASAENQSVDNPITSYADFTALVQRVGLADAEIVTTITPWGMGYWGGQVLYGSVEQFAFANKIYQTLFPSDGDGTYKDYCQRRAIPADTPPDRTWINRKCDAFTLWGHIFHDGDIFVTSDGNFHKQTRHKKLIALGAKAIMRPAEAVAFLQQLGHRG